MLLYGAYGYLGHLRWHSIRARGVPMCSAVTWLRHATTCAHTVRLLSAHFDFSAIVYRCPIAIYPPTARWLSHSRNCCFLEKIYFHLRFNIHLPNSIYIYRIQYTSTKFNIHLPNSIYIIYTTYRSIVRHSLSKFTPTFTIRFVPD